MLFKNILPEVKSSLHSSVGKVGFLLSQPPVKKRQVTNILSPFQCHSLHVPSKAALHVDKPLRLELSVEVDGAPNAKREKSRGEKKDDGFCKRAN